MLVFCISCVWQLLNKRIYDDDDDDSSRRLRQILSEKSVPRQKSDSFSKVHPEIIRLLQRGDIVKGERKVKRRDNILCMNICSTFAKKLEALSCCSTDSDRPHRCWHLASYFGWRRIFPILFNEPGPTPPKKTVLCSGVPPTWNTVPWAQPTLHQ